jgi:HEAT repeat protein
MDTAGAFDPPRRLAAITSLEELGAASAPKVIHAALADRDEDVRIEASRALIRSGADDDIRESLAFATTQPPLVRAVLAEDLKQHMEVLCKGAIQQLLKSTDTARVLATLEIIESWQRSITLPGFAALLKHPDDAVRAQVLRVLPYAAGDEDARNDVIPGLEDESPGVRAAAAAAAARMQLSAAVKPLAQCLHDRRGEVALEALERFRIGRTELVTF